MHLMVFLAFGFVTLSAQANVVGTGAQNFNTTPGGLDFVTVHSSQTLRPGFVNFGFLSNIAVNSLPYLEEIPQGRTDFNDLLWGGDLNLGVGLLENWEAGVSFPFVFKQIVNASQTLHGEFSKAGNTEVRFQTKYKFLGDSLQGAALMGSVNLDRIKNNPYTGLNAGPNFNLELAIDRTWGRFHVAMNIGYRFTHPGTAVLESPIEPLGNQWIASIAGSTHFLKTNTRLITEIFSSAPATPRGPDAKRSSSSLEWIFGVKQIVDQNMSFHAGMGTELLHGFASPDWRFYAGINLAYGPWFGITGKPLTLLPSRRLEEPPLSEKRFVIQGLFFPFGSDQIEQDVLDAIQELVERIKFEAPYEKIIIEGHTDSIGSEEYNLKLSLNRAVAIAEVLVKKYGLSREKMQTFGYGETRPIADNGDYQGRHDNRRVEFRIIKNP